MNENPNNPVNPAEELAQVRKTRGLSKLVGFSEPQFERINAWLDEQVAYRKIAEYCLTEWQREVPHMTIARYAKRRLALVLAADLDESKEAAAEISPYAAAGDATFSTNTLELLEQKAFDLAAVYQRDSDAADLDTIKQLTSIINKARNTKIRERHATVQEQKLQLRREEFALKRELQHARLNGRLNPNPNLTLNPSAESRTAIGTTHAASADPNVTNAENPSASTDPKSDHDSRSELPLVGHTLVAGLGSQTKNQKSEIEDPASSDRFPTPNPLPYEIYLKNCAYTEKLLAGLVDPVTGRVLDEPAPTQNQENHPLHSQPSTPNSVPKNGDAQ